ncbi:hypothetical protein [Streptomyces sp. HF10]|uniref:hypothetical protein n=1 Tax=Streptomyces sp. HF10 TaxID=2692233 RepID=UPI00131963A9|nr:hypothetical protein [Streptomyces sp. HF10]QHC33901.1 hypothetical protein GR129_34945 [Streptomyces sp. HF10]
MTTDSTDPHLSLTAFAELARPAWELYAKASADGAIATLISDLAHLADIEGEPGGGRRVLRLARTEYLEDLRRYPVVAPKVPRYLGQFSPEGDWITIVEGDATAERADVANCLWVQMQRAGLHTDEIPAHVEDLVRGAVLTADNGTRFRVIDNPACSG